MKKFALVFLLFASPSFAQDAPVPLTADERQFILHMCEVARWASRIQFDTACEALKAKFADADKAVEKPKEEKK